MAIDPKIVAIHELCDKVTKYREQELAPDEFLTEMKSIVRNLNVEEKFFNAAAGLWAKHYGAGA